jgi:hypothetical protein
MGWGVINCKLSSESLHSDSIGSGFIGAAYEETYIEYISAGKKPSLIINMAYYMYLLLFGNCAKARPCHQA